MFNREASLYGNTQQLANETLYLFIGFQRAFTENYTEIFLFCVFMGLFIFMGALLMGATYLGKIRPWLGSLLIALASMYPITIDEREFETSAFEGNYVESSFEYEIPVIVYFVWHGINLYFSWTDAIATNIKESVFFDRAGVDGFVRDTASNSVVSSSIYGFAQALQSAKNSTGYLIRGTPLQTAMSQYSAACTRSVPILNSSLINNGQAPISDNQWLSVGLLGGGSYLFWNAADEVGLFQDYANMYYYSNSNVDHGFLKSWGFNQRRNSAIGAGADYAVEKPRQETINVLQGYPAVDVDLTEKGVVIANEQYWKAVFEVWIDQISEQGVVDTSNSSAVEGRLSQYLFLHTDELINQDFIKRNVYQELYPLDHRRDTGNRPVSRFYPSNCGEFFQIVRMSWVEFTSAMGDYIQEDSIDGTFGLEKSIMVRQSISSLTQINSFMTESATRDSTIDGTEFSEATTTTGFLDVRESLDVPGNDELNGLAGRIATGIVYGIEAIAKMLVMYMSGPAFFSQLIVGLVILTVFMPMVVMIQPLFPNRDSFVTSYLKVMAMLALFLGLMYPLTVLMDWLTTFILSQSVLSQQNIDFLLNGEVENDRTSLNTFDVMMSGLHYIGLSIYSLVGVLVFSIVQGDSRVGNTNPVSNTAGRIATGIAGLAAMGAARLAGKGAMALGGGGKGSASLINTVPPLPPSSQGNSSGLPLPGPSSGPGGQQALSGPGGQPRLGGPGGGSGRGGSGGPNAGPSGGAGGSSKSGNSSGSGSGSKPGSTFMAGQSEDDVERFLTDRMRG